MHFINEFEKMSEIVSAFECVSGAILSRNKKCHVLGLGKWTNREHWPIPWLRSVQSVKVFGIHIFNSYSQIISVNWKLNLEAFSRTVFSWTSRSLETIQQRVEVLKVFGLSRVYYVASILPMRKYHIKKFESIMGNFVWRGRILRIALDELKNDFSNNNKLAPTLDILMSVYIPIKCAPLFQKSLQDALTRCPVWQQKSVY